MDMDQSLTLIAAMGKEAFIEWRRRSSTHRPEECAGNMLALLDAVGEEEFRQMAHQKYLITRRSAPPSASWRAGLIEVIAGGGAEPTHSRAAMTSAGGGVRGRLMGHGARAQSVVRFGGALRTMKMEDEADLLDQAVSHNSSLSTGEDNNSSVADAIPQLFAQVAGNSASGLPWTDAETAALNAWIRRDDATRVNGRLPAGQAARAVRAKKSLLILTGRSVASVNARIKVLTSLAASAANVPITKKRVVARKAKKSRRGGKGKRVGVAVKTVGDGGSNSAFSAVGNGPRQKANVRSRPTNPVRVKYWSAEEDRAIAEFLDEEASANGIGDKSALKLSLEMVQRAHAQLADVLVGRTGRAVRERIRLIQKGIATNVSEKSKKKAVWSPQQKARLTNWVLQNDAEKKADSHAAATQLAERAKKELGEVFANRSARAISLAILKINRLGPTKLDEWTKKSGI